MDLGCDIIAVWFNIDFVKVWWEAGLWGAAGILLVLGGFLWKWLKTRKRK